MTVLPPRSAALVFLAFAFAYFLSALLRAVTGTLAQEFALHARDLGLLSGGYFLGFSATQLPLGRWLDRHGPRKVLLGFLGVAVLGCGVFALAGIVLRGPGAGALPAYNLVIFVGVFVVQWGVGLAVDGFMAAGLSTVDAYRAAVALYLACNVAAYAWFMRHGRGHNGHRTAKT